MLIHVVLGGLLLFFFTQEQNSPENVNFEPRKSLRQSDQHGLRIGPCCDVCSHPVSVLSIVQLAPGEHVFHRKYFSLRNSKIVPPFDIIINHKSLGTLDKFVNISHKFYLYNYANSSAER